jgi:hypothetical protein
VTFRRFAPVALAFLVLGVSQLAVAGGSKEKNITTFGSLESASAKDVQAKAKAWFDGVVKGDAAKAQALEAIWSQTDRAVIDRLADTFALADPAAQKLLAEARDIRTPAPTEVPAIFKDAKQNVFFRANLAVAFAKTLSNRRIHEEALETLRLFRPEQTIDPATYLFHRAVSEHALLLKKEAGTTINRLVQDAVDSPERYKIVSMLILLDMQTWKDKDLAAIARKMSSVERRLELARGGEQTQKIQRDIIARLDELIKELENKQKDKKPGDGPPSDGPPGDGPPKPGSGKQGGPNPSNPLPDSILPQHGGTGKVDQAKLRKLEDGWGKMTPRERAEAMQQLDELTRGLAPAYQEAYRNYFRNLATEPAKQ